jgi:drug/metabolite transporter (DMT)-like permease
LREFGIFAGLTLVWGSNWLAVKIGLDAAPPFWFASIRFVISFLTLGAIILFRKPDYSLVKRNFGKIFFAGLVAYGVCYALIYWGQRSVSSGTAAVLFSSIPFFVAIFSVRMLPEEKVTPIRAIGITIGFAGLVVIFFGDISLNGSAAIVGAMLITASAAAAGFIAVFIKRHLREIDSLLLTHTQMIPGLLLLLILAITFEDFSAFDFSERTILPTIYLAVFGTAFAFWGYFYLLARVNAVKLSLVGFLTPVVALCLGWAVLNESITSRFVLGAALVMIGVWFASREPGEPADSTPSRHTPRS